MDGYRRLNAQEVWTDGTNVIVLENGHNCDEVGCGQCHVLLRADDIHAGFDFAALAAKDPLTRPDVTFEELGRGFVEIPPEETP